jgi:hypothetical protein
MEIRNEVREENIRMPINGKSTVAIGRESEQRTVAEK